MSNSQSRGGSLPRKLLIRLQAWDEEWFAGNRAPNRGTKGDYWGTTLPAPFVFFSVFGFFFMSYFCVEGRGRSFFFILCSKSWRIYEAILCLWGHCLHRFFSLLKTISRLKLTSIPANSGYVQSFLWVNREKKLINIVLGYIINT